MNCYTITFQTVSWGETNTNNVRDGKWGGDKGNGAAKQTWCPESLAIYRAVTDWWHQLAVNAGHTLLLFITGTHFVRSIPSTDMRQDGKCVLIVSGQRTHSPWPREGVLAFITDVTNLHKLNDWKHHQSRHPRGKPRVSEIQDRLPALKSAAGKVHSCLEDTGRESVSFPVLERSPVFPGFTAKRVFLDHHLSGVLSASFPWQYFSNKVTDPRN